MPFIAIKNLFHKKEKRFVLLGKEEGKLTPTEATAVQSKIKRRRKSNLDNSWGTLGWADDGAFNPSGKIAFSAHGNKDSKALTLEEIKNLHHINPELSDSERVLERYINFDAVDFGFDKQVYRYDELPELRLTLFLEPTEGAVVFYQISDKVDYKLNPDYQDPAADIDYILCESTGPNHHTDRDRLNYIFPILPQSAISKVLDHPELIALSSVDSPTSFIVKILTFKRKNLIAADLAREGTNALKMWLQKNPGSSQFVERYGLLKFDAEANRFFSTGKSYTVDYHKKTLLLVHGTFVDTDGSFGELYGAQGNFFQKLMRDSHYDQILAFDHVTIFHDAEENCKYLYSYFEGNRFTYPVDLIGTSRGAVVCHRLSGDAGNTYFSCGRILSISGGFGVAYFTVAKRISKFLQVYKLTCPGAGTLITMLAQFSIDYFIKLPGCVQITPDSDKLTEVTRMQPKSSLTVYQNIQVDWERNLVENIFKRVVLIALDAILKLVIGSKHDMVVGFNQQAISPANQSRSPIAMASVHTKNFSEGFSKPDIQPIIEKFLTE